MNHRIFPGFALLVLVFGSLACQVTIGGGSDSVRGSGNVVEEQRSISGVTSVIVGNQGDLIVEIGDQERLVIEAEDNLLPYIETTLSSGRLEINTQRGFNLDNREPIRYHLTVKSLVALATTSSGDITAPQLSAEKFSIDVSSSGEVTLAGLNAQSLNVEISSSGDVTVESGVVEEQTVSISSSGNYQAAGLQSQVASVEISSSGEAKIKVSDRLQANLSSSGDLYYSGDPDVDIRRTSSGEAIQGD